MSYSIPVNLIRQFCFCPRVPYFQEFLGFVPYRTQWVDQGERFHVEQEKVFKHRTLKRFGLEEACQKFNIDVSSESLSMHGVLDSLLLNKKNVFPIEFKLSEGKPNRGQILQVVAYGMVLEENLGLPCNVAFIVSGRKGKTHYIDVKTLYREQVIDIRNKIVAYMEKSYMPGSSATHNQCTQCEYLNYCNDRF